MSCGPGAAFGKIIIKMITDISKMTVNLDVAVDVLIEKVKEEGAKAAMAAAEKAKQQAIAMAQEKAMEAAMESVPECPPMEALQKIIETKNNIQKAARLLDVSRTTLYNKLKKYPANVLCIGSLITKGYLFDKSVTCTV